MNNVTLIGRMTRDPELKYTQGQMAVCRFSIAIDRFVKDGDKKADFPSIICFGKTAENCERFLKKGRQVGIVGRLQTGSYKDKDGKTVYTTDVVADRVEFIGSARAEEDKPEQTQIPDDYQALNEDVPF